ncbi:bone morphogenetic protein receptor type-2 [Lepisosteus oculatus]|uniref:bone morphogenetic protein receptor type-2 n=1 Tax=Lepisosteus oculatus TaxID=7918 RepID=UPI0035F5153C
MSARERIPCSHTAAFGVILVAVLGSAQGRTCFFVRDLTSTDVRDADNINGPVQHCSRSECCVGFFEIVDGVARPERLGCYNYSFARCPRAKCTYTSVNDNFTSCLCNSDFCNGNITWVPESEHATDPFSQSYSSTVLLVLSIAGMVLIMLVSLMLMTKCRHAVQKCGFLWRLRVMLSSVPEEPVMLVNEYNRDEGSPIDLSTKELHQILSRGHYADVWKGTLNGVAVAFKIYPPAYGNLYRNEKEVYSLPMMEHGNVALFLGAGEWTQKGHYFLLLELAQHGSLKSFLSLNTNKWEATLKLGFSLAQGLTFLHEEILKDGLHKPAIVHRDLSSNNVLVKADGTCVLCDFGSSTILHTPFALGAQQQNADVSLVHAQVGTLRYMAPEVLDGHLNLRNRSELKQADVYALGLLLWEIAMRCTDLFPGARVPEYRLPYEAELGPSPTLEDFRQLVYEKRERPFVPQLWKRSTQFCFSLEEILGDCWDHDAEARSSAPCTADRLSTLQAMSSAYWR